VALYTMDEESSRRGGGVDGSIRIALSDITIDDIEALSSELKMGEGSAALITARQVYRKFGVGWIERLISMSAEDLTEFCKETGAHQGSLEGLKRKLETIADLKFVVGSKEAVGTGIDGLIKDLKAGRHVILMFGQHRSTLAYMLVANILTKRIHEQWVRWSEDHEDGKAEQPKPLMITIEEAHKFLNPRAAAQTIFGTIAREMRKYNVTLLVVDQRPSGIDPEVASQLGTRLTALLTEENDIRAVFAGVSGAEQLRTVLASLDTKKQALILGHAVPMPVVVRVREYDAAFFAAMKPAETVQRPAGMAALQEAFG